MKKTRNSVCALLCAVASNSVFAVEGGQSVGAAAFGIEGQGYFALPPPGGLYWLNYLSFVDSDKILDNKGRNTLPGAEISATINVFRLSYFPETELLGAHWRALEVFLPYIKSEMKFGGQRTSASGWGDLAIDPFGLAWKLENANIGFSTTVSFPTGSYRQSNAMNLGKNHVSWLPQFFYTRYLKGNAGNISFHAGYEYNFRNRDGHISAMNPTGADYKSGQVLHMEAAYARNLTPQLSLGASVVASQQITDDKIYGDRDANQVLQDEFGGNRYKNLSLGLSAQYLVADRIPVRLTYTRDVYARSKSKNGALTLMAVFKL
ncbi:transporter [Pseudomonas sp. S 311-6]|nr:transporter [Pseudomonas sp. S 311-6]